MTGLLLCGALLVGACSSDGDGGAATDTTAAPTSSSVAVVAEQLTDASVERTDAGYLISWVAEPADADAPVEVAWGPDPDDPATVLTTVSGSTSVEVDDPAAGERVYFRLSTDSDQLTVAERGVPLEGVANFRDLGGYETADGRRVNWGQLYRSGELGEATSADIDEIAALGVSLVCDFRTDFEVEELPDPEIPGAEHVRIPIADEGSDVEEITNAVLSGDLSILGPELLIEGNAAFVRDFADQYAAMLERVADPANRPTNIHCSAGKDRAGFGAAVILLALGVPEETVMEDYLLSNGYRAEANQETLDTVRPVVAAAQGIEPEAVDLEPLSAVLEVRPEYLQSAFDTMKADYGSIDGYLADGLGLSDDDLTALREQLLQ